MGYDDLKVIEASLLLESVVDGVQREPGVREALAVARSPPRWSARPSRVDGRP